MAQVARLQFRALPLLHKLRNRVNPRLRNLYILRRRARADPYRAHNLPVHHDRNPTADQHEPPTVRVVNAVRRSAGQEVLPPVRARRRLVAGGREGFVDGDLDRGQLCGGHAREVQEVEGAVYEGDVEVWNRSVGSVSRRGSIASDG